MANQTVKDAISIKGTNPQYLVEKIVRSRIYDARYWKEECFGLTAELVVDKAMELKSVGGIYGGNVKPTPFLCLILKMLQIQPEKDIIVEFIRNEDFKYMRALGAFYMRLTGTAADVYKYLEPLYIDYRKMKRMNKNAKYELVHMDEFIDELLHGERVCDVSMPRLQKRYVLEETNELEPRISPLEVNLDEADSDEEEEESEASEASDKEDKKKSDRNNRKKDDRDDDRRRNDKDENNGRDKKRSDRGRYVDYDRPDDDDVKFYEKRRERTPERHQHRSSSSRHQHESHSSKRGSSRERDRDRDRERDRDRNRDRSRDRDASSKKSSSSKRRDRSKDRSHHH